ncbi:MAG: sigma-70 family RNA polymerase sigma factor [Acidobacteria bacterium]|nr:sigma-70 family RNA polymerase sigma factor [Acidobacteriota bacterium]
MPTLNRRETDDEFIAACRRGDRAGLAALYQAHKDKVYSIALHFFHGDAALAADITQQVFLKLITGIGQFRGDAVFTTWLYRLVANTCIDASRRRKPEVSVADLHLASTASSPAAEWERKRLTETVQAAVAALPEPFRLAVLLRHFEELSYEEIAAALECSTGTVASRLSRAHRMLAEALAPVRSWFETKE